MQVYVIVGCDAVSASSQLDTYIDEMQAGGTLRANAFELWHSRCPLALVWLADDLISAPASQDHVERIFSLCGLLYSGRRSTMFRSLKMRDCLKLKDKDIEMEMMLEKAKLEMEHELKMKQLEMGRANNEDGEGAVEGEAGEDGEGPVRVRGRRRLPVGLSVLATHCGMFCQRCRQISAKFLSISKMSNILLIFATCLLIGDPNY